LLDVAGKPAKTRRPRRDRVVASDVLPAEVESAAAEKKNNDDDDEEGLYAHGVLSL
jgi:hypothetical protein